MLHKLFRKPLKSLSFSLKSFFTDPMISVSEANSLLNSSYFLDIRDPKSFQQSHIPGAQNLNEVFSYLGSSDSQGNKALFSTFEKLFQQVGITGKEHIITYEECLKTRFGASCRGYFLLRLLGHKNVSVLHGGYEAWLQAKYPTTNEVHKVGPSQFQGVWTPNEYAGKDDILEVLQEKKEGKNQKNTVLLDVRDLDEWKGETSSPYGKDFAPRKGVIPGAIHLIWKDLMENKDGGTFIKGPKEVLEMCQKKGIDKDSEVIVYCFKGARASNTMIALQRAGFKNVKNYFASWNEWSRDNELPIAVGK